MDEVVFVVDILGFSELQGPPGTGKTTTAVRLWLGRGIELPA